MDSPLLGSQPMGIVATALLCILIAVMMLLLARSLVRKRPNYPPAVPGLPIIGNLLQLKEKKPHQTFARWAEIYGPIYSIRTGASTVVVLNSAEVAKEAMERRFSSISTRKLSRALELLTSNKAMVATSDYGQFYKRAKHSILTSVLGAAALKRHRHYRDSMIEHILCSLNAVTKDDPLREVNLRDIFTKELFSLALKEAIGKDVLSIRVEELGAVISQQEMFDILVYDPMKGAIEVDWRDFFPYLRWIPNPALQNKIQRFIMRRNAVMRALIAEQKERIASGEAIDCYLDFLVSEDASLLTEEQLTSLIWEAIIEASDTTAVTTEWAMFELAKNPICQERLYRDIRQVCGSEKMGEEHIALLPYLTAVVHETLRRYSPAPIVPLRYVHEDTQLGGYNIPMGTEIAINIYGCNMNKEDWDEPHEWNPERFLSEKYDPMDLHKTMAFGAGKRVCAGSLRAMLLACTSVGRFVQEFEWKLKDGEEGKVDMVQLTTHKLHPMLAHIRPRRA